VQHARRAGYNRDNSWGEVTIMARTRGPKDLLSSKECDALPAGRHHDGAGLYLVVNEARSSGASGAKTGKGSRSWVFTWTSKGKRREMGLGSYGNDGGRVSLSSARSLAVQPLFSAARVNLHHPCRIHSSKSRDDNTFCVYSQSSPRSSATSRMYRSSIGGRSCSTRCEKFLTASRSRRTASIHWSSKPSGSCPSTEKISPKRADKVAYTWSSTVPAYRRLKM